MTWWMLLACVDGEIADWLAGVAWDGDPEESAWETFSGGQERASGRWVAVDSSYDDDNAARADEAFGPYAFAPYETCDPREAQCSWERQGMSVDWHAPPNPSDPGFEYVPVVRLGDGVPRMPDAWLRHVSWTFEARRYEDVPHAGCSTLRGDGSSGGAHCCTLNLLVTVCPEAQTITLVDTQDGDGNYGAKFADVDHDGTYEFAATDWSWDLSFNAVIWRVLAWTPEGWVQGPASRFREFYEAQELDAEREFDEVFTAGDDAWMDRHVSMRFAATAGSYASLAGDRDETVRQVVSEALSHYVPPEGIEDPLERYVRDMSQGVRAYAGVTTIHAARAVAP